MNVLDQKTQMLNMAYEKLEAKNQELEELRNRLGHERSNLEQRVLQEAAEAREALSKVYLF
jgi:peptidoglycan hydrolase CwlO-like protein